MNPDIKIRQCSKSKIIAVLNKKIIGYLNFHHPGDASFKRNIEISYLTVKTPYRKEGIGSAMIEYLIKKHPKITWISLWTSRGIETVQGLDFYIRNGFKRAFYQEDYYKPGIGATLFVKRIN